MSALGFLTSLAGAGSSLPPMLRPLLSRNQSPMSRPLLCISALTGPGPLLNSIGLLLLCIMLLLIMLWPLFCICPATGCLFWPPRLILPAARKERLELSGGRKPLEL